MRAASGRPARAIADSRGRTGPAGVGLLGVSLVFAAPACGGGGAAPADGGRSSSGDASNRPSPGDAGGSEAQSEGGTGPTSGCGAGDPNMPAEPALPPPCTTLTAGQAVASGMLPDETNPDTVRIQSALNACSNGQSVQLVTSGSNNAFLSGPLSLPSGVTLWIDAGVTLYGSRTASAYGSTCGTNGGSCTALITTRGSNTGIVGDGVIDGQGGEMVIGQSQSWWALTGSSNGASANPTMIQASGASAFVLYRITLHNSAKFHVKLDAKGFVVWGITIKTPSESTNSQGAALTASGAHNTDGIDPGESASDGYVVCSNISDGDDQIAIKGGVSVNNLLIAHNHFAAGHGMSIGSETNGGVSNVNVYDLSIDGTGSGMGGGSSNGIRIKSDPSVGGPVTNVTYSDVCVRDLVNPIIVTPHYSSATGSSIPDYTGITIRDFHSVGTTVTPKVTLDGYDSAHPTEITLDNVVVDGIASSNVTASYASVTLGPGDVNFAPTGTGVSVTSAITDAGTPNPCTGKWVSF